MVAVAWQVVDDAPERGPEAARPRRPLFFVGLQSDTLLVIIHPHLVCIACVFGIR
jgi:hypothetical protein